MLGAIDFEFANPKTTRVYVVTLKKDTPSPFGVQSDETEVKKAESAPSGQEPEAAKDAKAPKDWEKGRRQRIRKG